MKGDGDGDKEVGLEILRLKNRPGRRRDSFRCFFDGTIEFNRGVVVHSRLRVKRSENGSRLRIPSDPPSLRR